MMGLLITLAALLLIASIPLGIHIQYDADGLLVRIIASCFRYTVFPLPKKKKLSKPKKENNKTMVQTSAAAAEDQQSNGGSIQNFMPFIKLGLRLMDAFRKKLLIDNLQVRLVLAADDPCNLAMSYGRTWAAVSNLLPVLENAFRIRKRDVEIECDFMAQTSTLIAQMELTIPFGKIISLAVVYGFAAIKEFWKMKKRKGGAAV